MKLKKGIVFGGGRKLALAVCLVALAGAAHATTYYSGKGGSDGSLSQAVTWYTDEARTTAADPQPTPTANDGNTYVFLESKKMQSGATFPEGTHVCFGTDGVEIGTQARTYNPNCNSANWTVPDGTIYGFVFRPNYNDSGKFLGNYRLVKTANAIAFGASSLKDDKTYGMYLAGTFTGASDVMITTSIYSYSGPKGNGIARTVFNGNFSGYKGRFETATTTTGLNLMWFASPTAMGDPATPFTDAVTLRDHGHIRIDEDVTQTSARGITLDLSSGQFAALYAPAGVSWTLRAPMYGGSVGTLKKAEAGTVTLAGSMEAKNILVEAGTLVVSNGASFASATTITVAPGAKLVNKALDAIPNVTVVVEDGGAYVCDSLMAIPFDGTDAEVVDCTAITPALLASLTQPIHVGLSQSIPLPFSETNRWAIATFDAARGLSAADFMDVTAKSFHRLPTTWLETETENGITTLYLVARPAIKYNYDSSNPGSRLATAANWSDGKLPHRGKDYFSRGISLGGNRTGTGSSIASYSFNGESFTFDNGIGDYAQDFFATELRMRANNHLQSVHSTSESYKPRIFRGRFDIDASATITSPAKISADAKTTYADLRAELTGDGTLLLTTGVKSVADGGNGIYPFYVTGMSANFAGRLIVTNASSQCFMDMYVTNGLAFGGVLSVYSVDAVRIDPDSTAVDHLVSITAMADMTVDAANRGWHMTSGTLGASNGVTFVFAPPTLTVTTKLCKTGGGTLALGCNTIGAGTAFAVEEGYVKALSAGCCTNLNLTVSADAGIKADLAPANETVAAKGLIAKSIQPAEAGGTILVAPDLPQNFAMPPQFTVVACTVPAEQSDLAAALSPAYVKGYKGIIEKDAVTYAAEGLVTYKVTWFKTGLTVIFR
ncbi:MAG: hypothetical protein J6V72_10170 [Kiritimatiellae bacterium]|nr:hypothetical protein [Kiritimatiellia bacterium]